MSKNKTKYTIDRGQNNIGTRRLFVIERRKDKTKAFGELSFFVIAS